MFKKVATVLSCIAITAVGTGFTVYADTDAKVVTGEVAQTAETTGENEFVLLCTAETTGKNVQKVYFDARIAVDVTPFGDVIYTVRAWDDAFLVSEKDESIVVTSESISAEYNVPAWYGWNDTRESGETKPEALKSGSTRADAYNSLGCQFGIISGEDDASSRFAWSVTPDKGKSAEFGIHKDDILGTYVVRPNAEIKYGKERHSYYYEDSAHKQDGIAAAIDIADSNENALDITVHYKDSKWEWKSGHVRTGWQIPSIDLTDSSHLDGFPLCFYGDEGKITSEYQVIPMTYDDGTIAIVVIPEKDDRSDGYSVKKLGDITVTRNAYDVTYTYFAENTPFFMVNDRYNVISRGEETFTFNLCGSVVGSEVSLSGAMKNGNALCIVMTPKEGAMSADGNFHKPNHISIFGQEYTLPELYCYTKGDANGDYKVDIADAVWLQKWLLQGIAEGSTVKEHGVWQNADLDGDNVLTAKDLSMLKARIMNGDKAIAHYD